MTTAEGTLSITKVAIKITTGDATKEYDGTPLTSNVKNIVYGTVSATVADEISQIKNAITVTGSQTEVGGTAGNNTYTIGETVTDLLKNYEITSAPGTLTVTQSTKPIVITSSTK